MKQLFKQIFAKIGLVLSFIYPYRLRAAMGKISQYIHSGYIQRRFKSTGKDFLMASPVMMSGGNCISIGDKFESMGGLWIDAIQQYGEHKYHPEIMIGNNVTINLNCHIACINKITIGSNVLIASKVFITDHFHGATDVQSFESPRERKLVSKGGVTIGDNVWIGEGVVIMPDVVIGNDCIIGANSVVTKSFPDNSVIAGIPARLIKSIINE